MGNHQSKIGVPIATLASALWTDVLPVAAVKSKAGGKTAEPSCFVLQY